MSRLARRAVIATKGGGGGGGKTYAEFQAHIATLAASGSKAWGASSIGAGSWRTTAAAETGDMFGSPWLSMINAVALSAPCRVVQHGLPSQAVFNAQVAASREIFVRIVFSGTSSAKSALDRNGYLSIAQAENSDWYCDLLIYWDGAQAQQMNPSTGTGPTPYTW